MRYVMAKAKAKKNPASNRGVFPYVPPHKPNPQLIMLGFVNPT